MLLGCIPWSSRAHTQTSPECGHRGGSTEAVPIKSGAVLLFDGHCDRPHIRVVSGAR